MGRAPCCDKANVKKGPWSPEEDAKLKSYIEQHGTGGNWIALPPKIGLKRCGKSCRLRWLNYLRPNIKHGGFSEEEDTIICSLYMSIGSRWSIIAAQLPGRTDNDIKNYWNTRLKKKLLGRPRNKELQHGRRAAAGVGKQLGAPKVAETEGSFSGPSCGAAAQYSPCWPQQPAAAMCPNLQRRPVADEQASLRRLLMKLGGRFFDDDAGMPPDVQPPAAPSPATTAYDGPLDVIAAPSASEGSFISDGLNEKSDLLGEDVLRCASNTSGCFTTELDEMFCFNPAKLEGLDELISGIGNTTESLDWNDMINPLVHAPLISNYHQQQQ